MRHKQKGRKLGRKFQPRLALLRNLSISLLQYEKIKTTEAKAKEIKRMVDKIFSIAQKKNLAARRQIMSFLFNDAKIADKLFTNLLPRYDEKKRGGFTRIIRIGRRLGDNAPLVQIELV